MLYTDYGRTDDSIMEYVIETNNLTKIYPLKVAVNNVSLHVKKGDIYGLIGKNGAGKTTLMKMLLDLTFPSSGKMRVLGESENLNAVRKRIGSLIEEPGLFYNCSATENLKRFALLYGVGVERIPALISLVGLEKAGNKKVGAYSLGMKQRLGIALALLSDPEVMILDEPMNGLDPEGIRDIRDLILKLNEEKGVTFIISSHILEELSKIATTYGIMNNGSLVEEISAKDIETACTGHVVINTDDNAKAAQIVRGEYPDVPMEITAQGLVLTCNAALSAPVNKLLVNGGLAVFSLSRSENDFENFFIERMD